MNFQAGCVVATAFPSNNMFNSRGLFQMWIVSNIRGACSLEPAAQFRIVEASLFIAQPPEICAQTLQGLLKQRRESGSVRSRNLLDGTAGHDCDRDPSRRHAF